MRTSYPYIHAFYDRPIGGIVRGILQQHIVDMWDDLHGYRIMGCGYATPYIAPFAEKSERVFSVVPSRTDISTVQPFILKDKGNDVMLAHPLDLPIENASIDRIILVHYLEYYDDLRGALNEIWRVLKANGRVLIIVPNRLGFWARAESMPFGHGHPFTSSQICKALLKSKFCEEQQRSALFVPPLPDSPVMMRSAKIIERMGGSCFPFVGGVHMIDASKQIYARADDSGSGSAVLAGTKALIGGKPKPVAQCDGHRVNVKVQAGYRGQHHP